MKQILRFIILISIILCLLACSKSKPILEDISRDIYENHRKSEHFENLNDPSKMGEPDLTYDQYQRERREMVSDSEKTPSKIDAEQ